MSGDIHVRSYTRKREPRIGAPPPRLVIHDAKAQLKEAKRRLKETKRELKNVQLEAKGNVEEARAAVRKAKVDVQDARAVIGRIKRGEVSRYAPTAPVALPIKAVTSQFKRLEEE